MNLYQAVVHAFSTWTGGFSPYTASVGFFVALISFIIAFMLISEWLFLYEAYKNVSRYLDKLELRFYLGIILICTLLITWHYYIVQFINR